MYFVSTRLDWIEIETVKEMLKKGYEFYVNGKVKRKIVYWFLLQERERHHFYSSFENNRQFFTDARA